MAFEKAFASHRDPTKDTRDLIDQAARQCASSTEARILRLLSRRLREGDRCPEAMRDLARDFEDSLTTMIEDLRGGADWFDEHG